MNRAAARRAVLTALAIGITPAKQTLPAAWAAENIILPDGPHAGEKWDPSVTPQLVEPLNLLAVEHPANEVTMRKSSQVGYTQLLQGWMGYLIDIAPAKTMLVQPTVPAAQDFNREKFGPSIAASKILRAKVRSQVSRSSEGSTALVKRFPGGSIRLTGANSSADLRSKTIKNLALDEIDEWPLDLDGQGDPMAMARARQIAFTATGDWKRLQGSTPIIKGASRIDAAFEAGDQRYWYMACPHCGAEQKLVFFPDKEGRGGLRFNETYPHQAFYACRENGCVIEHWQKREMIRSGRWIAEAPGPGRSPSFHLDALSSLLTTWDEIAKSYLDAGENPRKLKTFFNLTLGLAYEEKGEAPEWKLLWERREPYRHGTLPPGALVLTGAADVQKNGIYYEVVAWGEGLTSWTVDHGFLEGETGDGGGDVWQELTAVENRKYLDHYGNPRGITKFAIDAGFNSGQVYRWAARNRDRRCAVKGVPGWGHAPIVSAENKDLKSTGKRKLRGSTQLWLVGTWSLKGEFYAYLRKPGPRDGEEIFPAGYCHFGQDLDERYFKQLTAEFYREVEQKGVTTKKWVPNGDNHFHDCRIYNMAMIYHPKVALHLYTAARWQGLRASLEKPPEGGGDLVQRMLAVPASPDPADAPPAAPVAASVTAASPSPPNTTPRVRRLA